jgi:hypothetical protein
MTKSMKSMCLTAAVAGMLGGTATSDPENFYIADPYTFLFAYGNDLGAGVFSLDKIMASRLASWAPSPRSA